MVFLNKTSATGFRPANQGKQRFFANDFHCVYGEISWHPWNTLHWLAKAAIHQNFSKKEWVNKYSIGKNLVIPWFSLTKQVLLVFVQPIKGIRNFSQMFFIAFTARYRCVLEIPSIGLPKPLCSKTFQKRNERTNSYTRNNRDCMTGPTSARATGFCSTKQSQPTEDTERRL